MWHQKTRNWFKGRKSRPSKFRIEEWPLLTNPVSTLSSSVANFHQQKSSSIGLPPTIRKKSVNSSGEGEQNFVSPWQYSMLIHKYFLKYVCINIEFKSVVLKCEKNLDGISVLVLISVLSKCKNPFYKFCYIFCYTLF